MWPNMGSARPKQALAISLAATWILTISFLAGPTALIVAAQPSQHGNQVHFQAGVREEIQKYTPEEAYDKALSLLSSVLAPTSNGKGNGSNGNPTSTSFFSPFFEALTSWKPLMTILKIFYRVQDVLNRLSGSSTSTSSPSPREGLDQTIPTGNSADTSRTGTFEDAAFPEMIWPNWEDENERDLIFFGPFIEKGRGNGRGDEESWFMRTPFVQDWLQGFERKFGEQFLVRKIKGFKESWNTFWKGKNGNEKKLEMKNRIEEAQRLLEWVGFGPGSETPSSSFQEDRLTTANELIAEVLSHSSSSISPPSPSGSRFQNPFKRSPDSPILEPEASAQPTSSGSKVAADALWVLAEHHLWGTHGVEPDFKKAKKCYERLSRVAQPGNATAHARLALLEGGAENGERAWNGARKRGLRLEDGELNLGLEEDEAQNQAKALLHYTIAARNGDHSAQMALGFRYKAGIGSPVKETESLIWYEEAAHAAHAKFSAGPPGGLTLPYTKLRLSDLSGGVYGPGASVASTGREANRPAIQAVLQSQPAAGGDPDPQRLEDMLEYYTYHADHGSAWFLLILGKIYYQGSIWAPGEAAGAVPRDFRRSREHFLKITREVWPTDAAAVRRGGATGSVIAEKGQRGHDVSLNVDDNKARHAASAASYLGRMYLRGEGVRQDFQRAWVWFQRGVDKGDPESLNGIGLMYRDGLGIPKDMVKATMFFEAAADTVPFPSADAAVNIGKINFDMGDMANALKYFDRATTFGNAFEGWYYMGIINAKFSRDPALTGRVERARFAVRCFKIALERGDWESPVFHLAAKAWKKGDRHKALLGWMIAGERGYEAAQNNVAWILDRDKRSLRFAALDPPEDSSTDRLALIQWTRSAGQDNIDALVKAGDYYFNGYTDGPDSKGSGLPSYEKAVACYQAAADRQVSALAYWNMGWMYETGQGVPRRDFPLAKRYYDMALSINKEAMLAVYLSLARLYLRAFWAAFHLDSHAVTFLERMMAVNDDGIGYTEAEEQALAEHRRNGGNLDPDEGLDMNLPEAYDRRQDRNRGDTRLDRETGEAVGGEGDDLLIEGALILIGLGALAYLVVVRHRLQLRVDRQRRETGQPIRNPEPQQGEIGGANGAFPWPPADLGL